MAAPQKSPRQINTLLNSKVLLLAAAMLLPGLAPMMFGWLSGLLATPVFCLLYIYGQKKGLLLLRNSIALAAIAAILLKTLPSLLFTLTLIPLGYSLCKSFRDGADEIQAAINGTVVQGAVWLIFWTVFGTVKGMAPYRSLLEYLDAGFAQAYEFYLQNGDIPPENLLQIEQAVTMIREMIPVIMPGILCCIVIATVWINLGLCAAILAKVETAPPVWKKFSQWRLPDKLVWLFIASGIILIVGPGAMKQAGVALLLTTGLLYFFQGLAIFIFALDKWKIPLYLRILIYGIFIIQSYGILLLTIVGLADVWMNFRLKRTNDKPDSD